METINTVSEKLQKFIVSLKDLGEKNLPKLLELFKNKKYQRIAIISTSVLGGTIIVLRIAAKRSKASSSKASSTQSVASAQDLLLMDPRIGSLKYPYGKSFNRNAVRKNYNNSEDISTNSQSDREGLDWERPSPHFRVNSEDWFSQRSDDFSLTSRDEERAIELERKRRAAEQDPDELFFTIFNKVNASLK